MRKRTARKKKTIFSYLLVSTNQIKIRWVKDTDQNLGQDQGQRGQDLIHSH